MTSVNLHHLDVDSDVFLRGLDKRQLLWYGSRMTSHALATVRSIHADAAARRKEFKERGIRDVITTMTWPNGLVEVSGFFHRGQFGKGRTHATLSEWAKATFGAGTLRKRESGEIEGRPTVTYEVV